jgi:hypothetical protein
MQTLLMFYYYFVNILGARVTLDTSTYAGHRGAGLWSLPEQCFEIAPSMHHAEDKNVLTIDTVDDDVLTHAGAARPGAEIFIAGSSNIGEVRQKKENGRLSRQSGEWHHPCYRSLWRRKARCRQDRFRPVALPGAP